jgi:hypothetical protein
MRHMSDRSTKRCALCNITVSCDMVNRRLPRSPDAVRGNVCPQSDHRPKGTYAAAAFWIVASLEFAQTLGK